VLERYKELDNESIDELTTEEYQELSKLRFGGMNKYAVSFQLKSPISKLVWLKGLMDNAGSCKYYDLGEDDEDYYDDTELQDSSEEVDNSPDSASSANQDAKTQEINSGGAKKRKRKLTNYMILLKSVVKLTQNLKQK